MRRDDPAFFTEDMRRDHAPRDPAEARHRRGRGRGRGLRARRTERDRHASCASATCSARTSVTTHARLLALPAVPMIAGFDPRYQFIHADDVVSALEFAVENELHGVYNVAADGVLVLSEVIDLLGKRALPVLPPVRHRRCAASALRRAGVTDSARDAGPAALRPRSRQPQAQGGRVPLPLHDPRDGEQVRRAPAPAHRPAGACEPYRYEKEVEDFLRWSPSVRDRKPGSRAALRSRRTPRTGV